ncbi:MAG: protoheme IX farnesyltransferase [Phycisphaeraceae bacterium]|nr:protoheme IX farnesyltransferase [Phycisphaeraceae bacterium]
MMQLTSEAEESLALSQGPVRAGTIRFRDLSLLTKPRITLMVAVTAYLGFAFAARGTMMTSAEYWFTLIVTLIGTSLSCMGACTLNQVIERQTDGLMKRTADRPLPAGRMTARTASGIGLLLSVAGVSVLLLINPLTALLSAITIASYVLLYTPMKRVSSICTIVGAIPGALPPVMGFTAAQNRIGVEAWIMFAILFLWQLPHFLAIAWLYKEDYARAGMPMLPVVDPDGRATSRQILLGCLALLPLGLLPTAMHMSGMIYFIGAMLAGLMFLGFGIALVIGQTRTLARALFFASLVYLPLVFALMVIDRV